VINSSAPLTKQNAVIIASRVVSIYFFAWAISDLLYLVRDIYSVHFFIVWAAHTGSPYDSYLRSEQIQYLCLHIIHTGLAFLVAGWAYRCGPGVTRYFFPDNEHPTDES
jgi:hypothetical protein